MIIPSKNKIRMLYLLDILKNETDENHVITSPKIMEMLGEMGFTVDRKSIYADFDSLSEYGYDVISSKCPRGFYLGQREFELPELRLMCDAVKSANFISQKKTEALLNKLEKFASKYENETLKQQVFVDSGIKTENEEIFYTIDKINRAIQSDNQISLSYYQRKKTNKFTARKECKEFEALNPYAMIWSNDHYYLVANNPKYDNLMHLRIDKIKKVDILETEIRPISEVSNYKNEFNAVDYMATHFNMFSGEIQPVELVCDNKIVDPILDRFGEKTKMKAVDKEHFAININAAISEGLVSWIMQYGNQIKVNSPAVLSKQIVERSKNILEMYE